MTPSARPMCPSRGFSKRPAGRFWPGGRRGSVAGRAIAVGRQRAARHRTAHGPRAARPRRDRGAGSRAGSVEPGPAASAAAGFGRSQGRRRAAGGRQGGQERPEGAADHGRRCAGPLGQCLLRARCCWMPRPRAMRTWRRRPRRRWRSFPARTWMRTFSPACRRRRARRVRLLIELAGQRQIDGALPAIMASVEDADAGSAAPPCRRSASSAGSEQVADLVKLAQKTQNPAERGDIEKALLAISGRSGDSLRAAPAAAHAEQRRRLFAWSDCMRWRSPAGPRAWPP